MDNQFRSPNPPPVWRARVIGHTRDVGEAAAGLGTLRRIPSRRDVTRGIQRAKRGGHSHFLVAKIGSLATVVVDPPKERKVDNSFSHVNNARAKLSPLAPSLSHSLSKPNPQQILRAQPANIYEFGARYFAELVEENAAALHAAAAAEMVGNGGEQGGGVFDLNNDELQDFILDMVGGCYKSNPVDP